MDITIVPDKLRSKTMKRIGLAAGMLVAMAMSAYVGMVYAGPQGEGEVDFERAVDGALDIKGRIGFDGNNGTPLPPGGGGEQSGGGLTDAILVQTVTDWVKRLEALENSMTDANIQIGVLQEDSNINYDDYTEFKQLVTNELESVIYRLGELEKVIDRLNAIFNPAGGKPATQ